MAKSVADLLSSLESGFKELDTYLADKSYVGGYTPTTDDVTVFEAVAKHLAQGPDDKSVNAHRWFKHIASFSESERSAFAAPSAKPAAKAEESSAKEAPAKEEADDDLDLFEDVDEEALAKQKADRAAAASAHHNLPVQKSNIVLDVKPWDDETDLVKMEELVRGVKLDGLTWGPSKLVDVAFGIKKLQISCVVEDEKVSTEDLEDAITAFSDHVQSMDIAAFVRV